MSAKGALFSLFGLVGLVVCFNSKQCYWNSNCLYDKFGIATPYDTVRGDLRDQKEDGGCEVLSIWSLHRHGNRNPGAKITKEIRELQRIITQKLHHFNRKHNKNCAQDMEDLMNWRWNSTLENSTTYLTGTGYEELYDLGRRMYIQYQNFLKSTDKVVFRATNSQRTETSLVAFVHGLTDGTPLVNFSAGIRPSLEQDDFLRPYDGCERFQEEVEDGQLLADELAAYDSSPDYVAIRDKVQERLPVDYRLKYADVFTLYQLCRFERSWSVRLRSPWCALFSDRDLKVLEYRDDVRHYYNNGYGSWMNPKLGAAPLRDLYENFVSSTEGNGKSLVSYFTHDTMMDMVFCALGLYKDTEPLRGSKQNVTRLWRTSQLATFATNFIAVLSRCNELGVQTHRVRLFINEKPTPLCPSKGCTWEQFLDIFQGFRDANWNFCAKESSKNGTVAF